MWRTATAAAFVGLLAGGVPAHAVPMVKATHPGTVVELFTSQGCSSCPPADRLLGEYAKRDDVLALSFSVDVWDWIGWPDTLASPANTARQRAYASAMGERGIYTPQAIINGREHVVGSDRKAIEAAWTHALPVPVDVTVKDDAVSVTIGDAPADVGDVHAMLWLVMFDRQVPVEIERGENAGKSVTYNNVVRLIRPITIWRGDAVTVEQSRMEIDHADVDSCAFLLQVENDAGEPGPILGAARVDTAW